MVGKVIKYFTYISILVGTLLTCSCATTLKLPTKTENAEKVYLLKYSTWGHHSLAFHKAGKLIEYTYGDWEVFALDKRDAWTAWKNITFHTQGALGRKIVTINRGDWICNKFIGCEDVVPFYAPENKVNTLFADLQDQYSNRLETEVFNSAAEIFFVKDERPYWAFHNCNHQLVEWLEFLGGEISGRIFYNPLLIEGMVPKQESIQQF